MKKPLMWTIYMAGWILLYMVVASGWSYLSEHLQSSGYFGDYRYAEYHQDDGVDKWYHWGTRHYIFYIGAFLLTITYIIRIAIWTVYYFDLDKELQS